jgi:uncharacterized protein (TIGR02246 family)
MHRPYGNSAPNSSSLLDVDTIIRGLTQDYCTAFNTGNYDQLSALFTSDGVYMPPHRESVQGPRAIEWLLRQYSEWGYQDLRLETVRVAYSGDVAVEIGRYTIAIHQSDGTLLGDRGKFVHGWRRVGAWLLTADTWNSDLPAAR